MESVNFTKFYQEGQIEWRIHDILSPPGDGRYNCFFVSQSFNFSDTAWRLLLVSELKDEPETARFSFMFIEPCKYSVKYIFFLKHPSGGLEKLFCGTVASTQTQCKNHYIKLKQLLQQRPEFVSSDAITIVGSLKAGCLDQLLEPKPKKLRSKLLVYLKYFNTCL